MLMVGTEEEDKKKGDTQESARLLVADGTSVQRGIVIYHVTYLSLFFWVCGNHIRSGLRSQEEP